MTICSKLLFYRCRMGGLGETCVLQVRQVKLGWIPWLLTALFLGFLSTFADSGSLWIMISGSLPMDCPAYFTLLSNSVVLGLFSLFWLLLTLQLLCFRDSNSRLSYFECPFLGISHHSPTASLSPLCCLWTFMLPVVQVCDLPAQVCGLQYMVTHFIKTSGHLDFLLFVFLV